MQSLLVFEEILSVLNAQRNREMQWRKLALYSDSDLQFMKSVFEWTCTFSPVHTQPEL